MTKAILPQELTNDNLPHGAVDIGDASDPLRDLFTQTLNAVMQQDVAGAINAGLYERHDDRQGYRNGTRSRRFDTRLGTLDLEVPRIRGGSYMPAFLTHRQRAEAALISLVQEAYVSGVSTRKMQKLIEALGVASLSKSQVSELNKTLDDFVAAFRERPLTAVYPYLMVDAVYEKIRFDGRSQSHAVVIAYGITDEGQRDLLGVEIVDTESHASWSEFFRKLLARGLKGVQLVISDAHAGLKKAIAEVLLGAAWQRCKVHFLRNILAAVPKTAKEIVAADLKPLFHQNTRETAMAIVDGLIKKYGDRYSRAMNILLDGIDEALTYLDFPPEHAAKISSTNPIERINREIRRRTRQVGVFPSVASAMRLIGMVLVEMTEDWEGQRGYMSTESMKQLHLRT